MLSSCEIREVALFDELPPDHKTFLVTPRDCEKHPRAREFAVVAIGDRYPRDGDLYLIQWESGRRSIVRAIQTMNNLVALGPTLVWYVDGMRGATADGPYVTEHLHSKLMGRVVGYSRSALGALIAPEAAFEDKRTADAAFDPNEYLDALIEAGYRPVIVNDCYLELFPKGRPAPHLEARYADVRHKYCAAPSAFERVKTECERRGWTAIDLNLH